MLFRFTLSNTIEGNHIITDPDGWKDIKLKLEREKEYHSLIEVVELPLIFYRTSDLVDGGYDYIINVEATQGIDAQIGILIEVSEDQGTTYETFFEGLLLLETIKDISDAVAYKLECNIARTSFWSKFFNRKSQDVNLTASVDLDGNAITSYQAETIQLPSQVVRLTTKWEADVLTYETGNDVGVTEVVKSTALGLPLVLSEIQTTYTLPFGLVDLLADLTNPLTLIYDSVAGTINVSCSGDLTIVAQTNSPTITTASVDLSVRVNNGIPITIATNGSSPGANPINETYTLSGSQDIPVQKNDEIFIYLSFAIQLSGSGTVDWTYAVEPGFQTTVVQNSVADDTVTHGFLVLDAGESIVSKLVGRYDAILSDYLGDSGTGWFRKQRSRRPRTRTRGRSSGCSAPASIGCRTR